jgi:hypothetical protein
MSAGFLNKELEKYAKAQETVPNNPIMDIATALKGPGASKIRT